MKNAELANWKLTFSKTKKTTKTLFLVVLGFFVFFFGSRFLECENANNIETENFGKLNEKNEFCVGKQRKQGNKEKALIPDLVLRFCEFAVFTSFEPAFFR